MLKRTTNVDCGDDSTSLSLIYLSASNCFKVLWIHVIDAISKWKGMPLLEIRKIRKDKEIHIRCLKRLEAKLGKGKKDVPFLAIFLNVQKKIMKKYFRNRSSHSLLPDVMQSFR